MAKVLKSKKRSNLLLTVAEGGAYSFLGAPENTGVGGMELVLSDKHAEELLAKYGDTLEVVQEADWPERYKAKVKEYHELRLKEAVEKFPDLVGEKIAEVVAPKKEDAAKITKR